MDHPLQQLIGHLTPDEQQELEQLTDYLAERSTQREGARIPEGSLAAVLNRASPNVRQTLATLQELLATPRLAPFAPKISRDQYIESFGLDPHNTKMVDDKLYTEEISAAVQQRMGTDADRPVEPPSRRDTIRAAYDAISQPSNSKVRK